jgi:signal transduction histidine kinase
MRHKNGSWRTVDAVTRNLLEHPDVAGVVVTARDVTEQRRLEAELIQTQKLESIGRLAGGIAHDFNNLISVIMGNAEILLEEPQGRGGRREIEEIEAAAGRAGGLTRQLLAFSRRQVLEPRVLDLNHVITNLEDVLRRLVGEGVELDTRLEPGPATVMADEVQVEQVLMNLAVNARDAMPQGGHLTITTSRARLDELYAGVDLLLAAGDYVRLTVTDTGLGMDAETRAHIFEPFFTTKAEGKGTGLGLATVYGIVKQSGGYIWVDSKPGRGTSFRVCLPLAASEDDTG